MHPSASPTSSALDIARAVNAGTLDPVELTFAAINAAKATNPSINAFTQIFEEKPLAIAATLRSRITKGEQLPLAGVPIAIKDNICLGPDLTSQGDNSGYAGFTTCASNMLRHYASPYTATAAQRLIDAGAIIIGKTNLDEFAMGSSTERSIFGPTRNPADLSRVPGGSSGGSAAAVAANITPISIGSDTGGSIRQPASHCGVFGIKPTYGRVSRYGLVAYASSLDQIGPLSRTVGDSALILDLISGYDPNDGTSARPSESVSFTKDLETPITSPRIGIPRECRSEANHPAVAAALEHTISCFRSLGAEIIDIDLPMTPYAIAAYYIIAPAEASSNLARFDGIRYGHRAKADGSTTHATLLDLYCRSRSEGFGPEVQRRIMLGTHVLSSGYYDAYYTRALKVRRRILDDYTAAFTKHGCTAILLPASPGPAFKIGEKSNDPMSLYLEDVYTVGMNLAGLPVASIPVAYARVDNSLLPIGMQLVSPAFEEASLLRHARMLEKTLSSISSLPAF